MQRGVLKIYSTHNQKAMEEKREKKYSFINMANSVAFSDEIPNMSMSSSFNFPLTSSSNSSSIFDMMLPPPPPPPPSCGDDHDQKASSFGGYMDLLGAQDYFPPSLFDWFPSGTIPNTTTVDAAATSAAPAAAQINNHPLPSPAGSEVVNTPATPVSSSISSSSNEATVGNKHQLAEDDEEGDADAGREDNQNQDQTKKQ